MAELEVETPMAEHHGGDWGSCKLMLIDETSDDEYNEYCELMKSSDEFDVIGCAYIIPCPSEDEDVLLYSQVALHHYNQLQDADFEFVKVEKVNVQCCKGCYFYITFKAKDALDGSTQTFQAKIWAHILGPQREMSFDVRFCRVKASIPSEAPMPEFESSAPDSGINTPPGKKQKTENASQCEAEQVEFEEEIDVSMLNCNHNWLGSGDGFDTGDDEYKEYCRQARDSEGFDVGNFSFFVVGQIKPLEDSYCSHNLVHVFSGLALFHYKKLELKKRHMENPHYTFLEMANLKFLEVEKANVQTNRDMVDKMPFKYRNGNFYITFKAKNEDDGSTQNFQALVWRRYDTELGYLHIEVKFCRLKAITPIEGN